MAEKITKLSPLALAGLLFLNVGYYFDLIMIPAWDPIYAFYADEPLAIMNFVTTGPQLFVFIGTLICTWLLTKLSKKTILVICFASFTVFGYAIGFNTNIYYFAVMRTLIGLSVGGLLPVAVALIAEVYYEDQDKVSMLTGVYNGVGAIAGAILTFVAGLLAAEAWQDIYKCYWVSAVILIMLVAFVPKTPPEQPHARTIEGVASSWSKGPLAATLMAMFTASVFYLIAISRLSFYGTETGLGDPAIAGTISSVMTLASALAGFVFGPIYRKSGRGTPVICYAMFTLGFLLLYIQGNLALAFVAFCLLGFAYTAILSYYLAYVAYVVPDYMASKAITLTSAAMSLGACASSYIFTFVMGIGGFTNSFLVPATGFVALVCLVISIVLTVRTRKSKTN